MRIALRSFIAAAAVSLTLVPSALADTATEDLVLARDACGSTDTLPPAPRLAFTPGASTLGCGSLLALSGGSPTDYPATEGVPVTLDDTRPIFVAVSSSSYTGGPLGGIGDETVEIDLTGKNAAGKTVSLGSDSQTIPAADMLQTGDRLSEFTLPIAGKGGAYQGITLTLTVGGSQFSGFVNHDGSSYVSLPIFDSAVPTEEAGA
ncbi:MAG: hypothetical protein JWM73_1232 [Solirubrobacterales bacterium]|nr:hypothetical protein [Solirubrobacterales bacterium]